MGLFRKLFGAKPQPEAQAKIIDLINQAAENWNKARNLWRFNPEQAIQHSHKVVLLSVEALHTAQNAKGVPINPSSAIFKKPSSTPNSEEAFQAHTETTRLLEDVQDQIRKLGFSIR